MVVPLHVALSPPFHLIEVISMRILHTIPGRNWGGMEHRTLEQVRWLVQHGHAVWLAAPADGESYRRAQAQGLPVVDMNFDRPWRWAAIRALRAFVREHGIEVIDSHVTRDAKTALACMDLCALVRSRHVNQPLKSSPVRRLQWHLSDRVITVAECTRRDMIASGLIDPARSVSVGGWADERFFDRTGAAAARTRLRAELELADDQTVALCVGMLRPDKGQNHLLRALAEMKRDGVALTCLLAGEATAESAPYEAELRDMATAEGVDVRFLGYRDDVADLMHTADLVVIPSLTEAQPRVAVQAFATGRPVVASAVGGVPEIVVDGETGWLVPPADPEALARALTRAVRDTAAAANIAARAAELAQRDMRFDQRMAQTLENYRLARLRAASRLLFPAAPRASQPLDGKSSVLHVITTINRGGAENHLFDLMRGQRAAGRTVAVAYLKGDGYWAEKLAAEGITAYPLGLARYGDPRPVWRLAGLIRRLKPAIVHAHMPPAELYTVLALPWSGHDGSYVVSKHNDEPFYRGPGQKLMARWAARRADRIIAISGAVGTYLQGQGLPAAKMEVVHYGLDAAPYDAVTTEQVAALRAHWGVTPDEMVVGAVGRLVPQKAFHVLLQGFADFVRSGGTRARLVMVGTGQLKDELQTLATKLGIAEHLVWAGFRTDIPVVMKAFDVFALTSAWEGFGLVLLEAMAAGRPIVASRVSAIPEVVAEGSTGLLVDCGAADQVAAALAKLAEPALRHSMGDTGRKRLGQLFSVKRMVRATATVYGDA